MTLSIIKRRKGRELIVVGVYRPPNAKSTWFSDFDDILLQLVAMGQIIILGDLNADLSKPSMQPGKDLLASLELAGTRVEKTTPTRIQGRASTCLDIIAIDEDIECIDYLVKDLSASDHFPVSATIKTRMWTPVRPVLKRNFRKINTVELESRLQKISPNVTEQNNVDKALSTWHDQFMEILDDVAPIKKMPMRKKANPSWWNNDIRFWMGRRDWLGNCLRVCQESERDSIGKELQTARKIVKSRIKKG